MSDRLRALMLSRKTPIPLTSLAGSVITHNQSASIPHIAEGETPAGQSARCQRYCKPGAATASGTRDFGTSKSK